MVINSTIKSLYTLILKYKEDASKYEDINSFTIHMDLIRNIIFSMADNTPFSALWPHSQPIYTAQQQIHYTLELAPLKPLEYLKVDFTIEEDKK